MLMKITKNDLLFKYADTAIGGDDPTKVFRDRYYLNRGESYEMVDFINSFNFTELADAHKIERMIIKHAPSYLRVRTDLQDWVLNNWKNYN